MEKTLETHVHKYEFLRQDIRPTKQWDGRVLERVIEDVFFCFECLDYKHVLVRREEPDPRSFGWREII